MIGSIGQAADAVHGQGHQKRIVFVYGGLWRNLGLKAFPCHVLLCIFDEEAARAACQHGSELSGMLTYLYHHTVGPTVPRCHRLCASIMPPYGGKSSSSMLMASTIHATIRPGQAVHDFFSF